MLTTSSSSRVFVTKRPKRAAFDEEALRLGSVAVKSRELIQGIGRFMIVTSRKSAF